ncbi:Uncharacterized protein Rs2_44547 [Raphanus sativus]|nr:Uncharacterized protein Rs2_44547 [Raphanus sativus]
MHAIAFFVPSIEELPSTVRDLIPRSKSQTQREKKFQPRQQHHPSESFTRTTTRSHRYANTDSKSEPPSKKPSATAFKDKTTVLFFLSRRRGTWSLHLRSHRDVSGFMSNV